MRTVTVNVTQADIDKGKPCTPLGCPLALAVSRAVRPGCSVGCETVEIPGARYGERLRMLPDEAVAFRQDFDRGQPVKPFSFALTLP